MSVSKPPKKVTNAYRKGWNEIFGRKVFTVDVGDLPEEKVKTLVDDFRNAKLEVGEELGRDDRPLANIIQNQNS